MYTVKSTYIKLRQELYRAKQSAVGSGSYKEHKEFYKNSDGTENEPGRIELKASNDNNVGQIWPYL